MSRNIGFIKFLLSDEKNQWDLGILQWFMGTMFYFGFSGYAYLFKNQTWDPTTWGIGLVTVLGSGAALQWMRVRLNGQSNQVDTGQPKLG